MGRPRKYIKTLSEAEKTELQNICNSHTAELRHVQRAKTILLCAAGKTNEEIHAEIKLSKPAITNTLRKWSSLGVDAALEDLSRPGRPREILFEARAWVVSLACTLPETLEGAPKTQQWTLSALAAYVREHCEAKGFPELKNVQKSTIWEILEEKEIKPHRMKYYLERKDPEFEEKAKLVMILYKRVEWILQMTADEVSQGKDPSELCGEAFVSYDEKPGIQAIGNVAPDRPPIEGQGCVARDYEYKRFGTVSLLAGIDLLNGEVTGLVRETHKSADFIDFLKLLDQKYDENLKINIILDNHSVHRSKEVVEFLSEKQGRFAFTFTPKHGSWLNLVESFFSKLAKQALKNLRVKSLEDLKKRISDWIEETNKEKVTYRWTWKLDDIEGAF